MRIASISVLLFCLLGAVVTVRADAPTTQPQTEDQLLQSWWDDLQKDDPEASRALLNFSSKPDLAVAFFRERLKPLTISEDEVNKLVTDLGSDDEAVWKPAFDKLEYFDPRLAISLQDLMNNVTEPTSRSRMVAVLCGYPPSTFEGKAVNLRSTGDDSFNFFSGVNGSGSSWWAEAKVSRLGNQALVNKKQWTRAIRAMILLQHIGTPDAMAIIKDMGTGHPEASPTKVAGEILNSKPPAE